MKRIISMLTICAVAVSAMAIPARRDGMIRTAADGTEKEVFLHGNEFFHYMTDAEGNWLDENTLAPMSEEQKSALKQHGKTRKMAARRAKQQTGVDRLLAPRGAVILVSFANKEFQSSHADMTDWAMGENYSYNGATGSIHQYFYDQSWGQYDLNIDVYGPVTVSKSYSYYGENNRYGEDKNIEQLIKEACVLAHDSCGADFSLYDSNDDGEVDWVVILYAGKGEADGGGSNTIWPHQYDLSLSNKQFQLDGKTVDHYCCLNEIDGQSGKRNGIGTFCHEFSHVMGLPDFYETNDEDHYLYLHTLLEWDIMDYGPYNNNGNTPPSYSAYERWFMGWIKPTLLNEAANVTLPLLNETKAAAYLTENGIAISNILNPNPKVFYMLENRKKEGWDAYLPGNGMLITKISFDAEDWYYNTVNNAENKMGVNILEAKPNSGSRAKSTDAYPAGATLFAQVSNYELTDIELSEDNIISFLVNGGGKDMLLNIDQTQDGKAAQKIIRDGQVYIIRNGELYDLNGRMTASLKE